MKIFHIAEQDRWEAARLAGSYAWSTRGRTLEDIGFLHASRADQWPGVLEAVYADHPGPLVLLTIDTDLLTSPVREDPVGEETFPHIVGPLNPAAVVEVTPLPRGNPEAAEGPGGPTFASLFLGEMAFRMIAAVMVMVVALGVAFAAQVFAEVLALPGLVLGFLLGLALVLPVARRRSRALERAPDGAG